MKCPVCGKSELVSDTRDASCAIKDWPTVIQAVTGEFCQSCGEVIVCAEEAERLCNIMAYLFNKQVHKFDILKSSYDG